MPVHWIWVCGDLDFLLSFALNQISLPFRLLNDALHYAAAGIIALIDKILYNNTLIFARNHLKQMTAPEQSKCPNTQNKKTNQQLQYNFLKSITESYWTVQIQWDRVLVSALGATRKAISESIAGYVQFISYCWAETEVSGRFITSQCLCGSCGH